jgi:two-component sensor histidine kinase
VSFIPSALASGDNLMTCEDITDRKQAEDQIKASLKEKEVLLREVHHRVKNNMQVISSLLNMQSRNLTDAKTADILMASINRIRSMALIHDKLYQTEGLSRIDVRDYIQDLSRSLLRTYSVGPNINLDINVDPLFLGIDTVMPLGILINELVTNSLKHAFPGNRPGRIDISLKNGDVQQLVLTVSDNGIGIPADLDHTDTQSMGMQLVITLVEQLEGTVELVRDNGTKFRVIFSVAREKA